MAVAKRADSMDRIAIGASFEAWLIELPMSIVRRGKFHERTRRRRFGADRRDGRTLEEKRRVEKANWLG